VYQRDDAHAWPIRPVDGPADRWTPPLPVDAEAGLAALRDRVLAEMRTRPLPDSPGGVWFWRDGEPVPAPITPAGWGVRIYYEDEVDISVWDQPGPVRQVRTRRVVLVDDDGNEVGQW
jgi:hypothetical protein